MHRDPEASIRRVAHFLDRPLTDDQVIESDSEKLLRNNYLMAELNWFFDLTHQVRLIAAHTRFDAMSRNPSVNYSHWDDLGLRNKNEARFMRNGRVGDWRRHFDIDTNRRFDEFVRQHLDNSELKFDYLPVDE